MKPKKSSPHEDELREIDFVPKSKEDNLIIGLEPTEVKQVVESAFTLFGEMMKESLSLIARLQREAREGRDG